MQHRLPAAESVGIIVDGPYRGWNVRIDRRDNGDNLVSVWRGECDIYPVVDDGALEQWLRSNPARWWHTSPAPPIGVEGVITSGPFEGDRVLVQALPGDRGGFVVSCWNAHGSGPSCEMFDDVAALVEWHDGVEVDWARG